METFKHLLTLLFTWLTVLMLGFALGFALGYVFNKRETIARAQEVLAEERLQFDASDLTYIAIGERAKLTTKNNHNE